MNEEKILPRIVIGFFAFLMSSTMVFAQTTMQEFLAKWENSKQYCLEVVDKMPDNLLDYKPGTDGRSFSEQISHLSGAIVGISKGFLLGGEPGFDHTATPQTKAELKALVAACYDYGKDTFSKLSEDQLAEEIDSFVGKATRRQIIALIDDHNTHHRGAAVAYIRANGIDPPSFRAN